MARTATIAGSHVTITGDPFEEGRDDYLELDLVDEDAAVLDGSAIEGIAATLRSRDTGAIVNDRDAQSVHNANGGAVTAGTFRLDLSAADLAAVGSKTTQKRELTLLVTHSGGKTLPIVVRFDLLATVDVT